MYGTFWSPASWVDLDLYSSRVVLDLPSFFEGGSRPSLRSPGFSTWCQFITCLNVFSVRVISLIDSPCVGFDTYVVMGHDTSTPGLEYRPSCLHRVLPLLASTLSASFKVPRRAVELALKVAASAVRLGQHQLFAKVEVLQVSRPTTTLLRHFMTRCEVSILLSRL